MNQTLTAATLTPATAGAELLERLRALLDRRDAVATLEEVRALADEVTAALRSTRGRIGRLARQAAAASKPAAPKQPAPKVEPVRTPAAPTTAAAERTTPRTPAPGMADRAVTAAASWRTAAQRTVRLVVRTARVVARHARALLARGRRDAVAPAVELPLPRPRDTEQREAPVPPERRPRAEDDHPMTAIPDLSNEQAAGLACIECGTDFWTTGTLKVPAGVSESTGEVVWACVGACARQAGRREPVGEQMELLP